MKNTVVEKEMKLKLKVKLTEEELLDAADDLARCLDDLNSEKLDFEATKSRYKSIIAGLEARIDYLQNIIRNKYEMRDVVCIKELDYSKGIVRIHRTDTGEEIEKREMSPEELQMEFDFE